MSLLGREVRAVWDRAAAALCSTPSDCCPPWCTCRAAGAVEPPDPSLPNNEMESPTDE